MDRLATFAFGVELHLVATADGGRNAALTGGHEPETRFTYRPNWGLPGMAPPEQTGGFVLGFSREHVLPGETVQVVIVPPFPTMVTEWSRVMPGATLPMYEGARVCGIGHVVWREETFLPLPPSDEAKFIERLRTGA